MPKPSSKPTSSGFQSEETPTLVTVEEEEEEEEEELAGEDLVGEDSGDATAPDDESIALLLKENLSLRKELDAMRDLVAVETKARTAAEEKLATLKRIVGAF